MQQFSGWTAKIITKTSLFKYTENLTKLSPQKIGFDISCILSPQKIGFDISCKLSPQKPVLDSQGYKKSSCGQ